MSEAKTPKGRMKPVLEALEKAYGRVHPLTDEPTLDHAVYLLLRDNWDWRKAVRALRLLQSEYVDWNEIRVSTNGELRSTLAPLGDRDLDVKIEKVRTLLDNLYKERNSVHMDFLARQEPESRRRFLGRMGVLSPAQVEVLLHALARDEWEVGQGAIRVLSRIGLLPRVYSGSSARKHVEELVEPDDLWSFQAHMAQHAEDVCQLKSPRCGDCCLVEVCGFKRKVGLVAGPG